MVRRGGAVNYPLMLVHALLVALSQMMTAVGLVYFRMRRELVHLKVMLVLLRVVRLHVLRLRMLVLDSHVAARASLMLRHQHCR